MKVVFLGTPEFAVPSLEALVAAGYEVAAVFTQPDRPRGRGQRPSPSPVKVAALELGLHVEQPERIRHPDVISQLAALQADAMVVVGFGQIIPQAIIDLPPLGIVNLHASLLPKYRGPAPIQWAIANGETRTGVTTMKIDAGLDTGDILLAREIEIGSEETAPELSARLAKVGAALLVETLQGLQGKTIMPQPQDHSQATYAPMLKREDGIVNWSWPAAAIHNRVRGFQPWPGVRCQFRGKLLHLWRTRPAGTGSSGEAGALVVEGRRVYVCCGEGTQLELLEMQIEGRNRVSAVDFVNGQRVRTGERLEGAV